jgi:hypothetical protein
MKFEALGNRAQDFVFDAESLTVGEYLTRWLKDSTPPTFGASTARSWIPASLQPRSEDAQHTAQGAGAGGA